MHRVKLIVESVDKRQYAIGQKFGSSVKMLPGFGTNFSQRTYYLGLRKCPKHFLLFKIGAGSFNAIIQPA